MPLSKKDEKALTDLMVSAKSTSAGTMKINVHMPSKEALAFIKDWMKGKKGYKLVTPVLEAA